ncbi:LIC_10190 family membrane protein [Spirulina major]|uniref:LIC_10190 family membrane protein n=1 Tax=Spirulina major TaxID=270636 RepID=UPI000932A792|nr:hypothetical protein [Spirulina major]
MVALLLAWLILGFGASSIGVRVLNGFTIVRIPRRGDRFILALWIGLLILPWLLLTLSLLMPLTPWVGAIVLLLGAAIALRHPPSRAELRQALCRIIALPWPWRLGLLSLGAIVAFFASQTIIWFDTGLYHYQIIRWFSDYGTVPGTALIHSRFGLNSSWYALAAPFHFGPFTERMGTVTGGFVLCWGLCHIAITVRRIMNQTSHFTDWFLCLAFCCVIPTLFWSTLPFGNSPDQPVLFLTLILAWLILVIARQPAHPADQSSLLLLLIMALAIALKPSALPLAFVAFLFHLGQGRSPWRTRIIRGVALPTLLVLPLFAFNLTTSGCLLYPSPALCFDLPWGVGKAIALWEYQSIQQWHFWIGDRAIDAQPWDWVLPWTDFEGQFIFLTLCAAIALGLLLAHPRQYPIPGKPYLMLLGVLGLVYVYSSAPSWRFGAAYGSLLPAFYLARHCEQPSRWWSLTVIVVAGTANAWLAPQSSSFLAIAVVTGLFALWLFFHAQRRSRLIFFAALVVVSFGVMGRHYRATYTLLNHAIQLNWLVPPALSEDYDFRNLDMRHSNDVTYFVPADGQSLCWDAPLPCTYQLTNQNIRLRVPERGLAGGFVRVDRD